MLEAFMGHWRGISAVGLGIISQFAGCNCQRGSLVGHDTGAKVVLEGPANLVAGHGATFSISGQGLGKEECPKLVTFTFVETSGGASEEQVVSPPTETVAGNCIVTMAMADHAFVAGPSGTTRPAAVKVALLSAGFKSAHSKLAVNVTTPSDAVPTAAPTATGSATPVPAPTSVPGFDPAVTYPTSAVNPTAVDFGDYNGPATGGLGAAVAADAGSSASSSVLVRTGRDLKTESGSYPLGVNYQPTDIAGGDFNGDGIRDLAVTGNNPSAVTVLDGTATGTFATPHQVTGYYGQPQGIATGDVNGDGKLDIATASPSLLGAGVALNTSAAGGPTAFASPEHFPGGPGTPGQESVPFAVALGDLDGDGRPDLVLADPNRDRVTVLVNTTAKNATTPTFAPFQTLVSDAGRAPRDVAVADIGGDGKQDIVVANYGRGTVSVFTNTTGAGATTITATEKTFAVGDAPEAIAIMNADNNGKPDLATANYGSGDASVLLNDEAGGFLAQGRAATGESPEGVAVGDLNGDARDDVVVANNGEPPSNFRAGSVSYIPSFGGRRSVPLPVTARVAAGTQIATSGSLKLLKGSKLGAATFGDDGVVHVTDSLLVGRMALRVAGQRLPGEPKGLRALLKADLRGTVDFNRYPLPGAFDPIVGTGTVAGRSRKDKHVSACVRLSQFDGAGSPLQKLTLLGATGKAARLRLTALIAPVSLDASPVQTGSTRPVVTVSTGKPRKLSSACRTLVGKLK